MKLKWAEKYLQPLYNDLFPSFPAVSTHLTSISSSIHGSIISNGHRPSPLFLQIETLHVSSIPPKHLYKRSQFRKACEDYWLVSAFNYSWSVCMLTLHFGFGINNEKCSQFWDSKRDISLESAISMDESEVITTQRCGH